MDTNLFKAVCLLLLFCVTTPVFSQENESGTKQTDNITSQAVQASTCVNTFTNQTVSSQMSVVGCSALSVQNVTVTNKGDLYLYVPNGVTINNSFTVQTGGVFNIGTESPKQTVFTFDYDASGNRIRTR